MRAIDYISSLFSIKKCYDCGQSGCFFCQKCYKKLRIYTPYCYVCKQYSDNFMTHKNCLKSFNICQTIVITHYKQKGLKKLLNHAKYYGKHQAYRDILQPSKEHILQYIKKENSILIPIPMNIFRKWKRGYNQTDIIVKQLSNILNIPYNTQVVSRKKHTKHQSHLSKEKRLGNLSDAFLLKNNNISKDTTIYLIDDIISTGSTVQELAHTFYKAGYIDIRVLVIASD